jgi:hypothetical protein
LLEHDSRMIAAAAAGAAALAAAQPCGESGPPVTVTAAGPTPSARASWGLGRRQVMVAGSGLRLPVAAPGSATGRPHWQAASSVSGSRPSWRQLGGRGRPGDPAGTARH